MNSPDFTLLTWVGLLCSLALSGCVMFPTSTPPGWAMGDNQEFPPKKYLVGVGEADSRIGAEQRAYAAVARIFQADVEAQARDSETYSIDERDGTSRTARQLTLDHVTQVSTKKVLRNVIILDRWERPHADKYFVLAGMDRRRTEKSLVQQISELDHIIDTEVTESRTAKETLTKIRRLKRAMKTLGLREEANTDLRIVRVSGLGDPPAYHMGDLKSELEGYLRDELSIRIEIQGAQASVIRRALMEGLSREGFLSVNHHKTPPSSNGKESSPPENKADLLIKGTATIWKADLPDPLFIYVRWCSDLLVLEDKPQRIIGVVSRSGREGHITQKEAFVRASKAMQAAVTSDVANALSDFIYGEVEELKPPSKSACPK